jgi:putative hydrolase of the HAD superfamily
VTLRYALFDLDNTLYPAGSGLWEEIGARISLYLTERMGFARDDAAALRRRYLAAFGTTLNGLRHDFQIDPHDYLAFVHDLPLERYLRPDPALDAMLGRLPLTKVVFTNADARHARRVLDQLGVTHRFARIIDILSLDFVNKPNPLAYQRALEQLAAAPAECLFIEDTAANLPPAHELGMLTVLLGQPPAAAAGIDFHVRDLSELEPLVGRINAPGPVAA